MATYAPGPVEVGGDGHARWRAGRGFGAVHDDRAAALDRKGGRGGRELGLLRWIVRRGWAAGGG